MKISRRNFIGALSASVAAVFPFAASRQASALGKESIGKGSDVLSQLNWRSFYPYLYTDFEFSNGRRGTRAFTSNRLRLSAMSTDEPVTGKTILRDPACFVLTFSEPASGSTLRLSQNTYTVSHFALGSFELFISEGNLAGSDYVYTAVINRATR